MVILGEDNVEYLRCYSINKVVDGCIKVTSNKSDVDLVELCILNQLNKGYLFIDEFLIRSYICFNKLNSEREYQFSANRIECDDI